MARALICGVSGQDGAYLARLLLSKNYEVWGTSRSVELNSFHALKQLGIRDEVKLLSMSPDSFDDVAQVFSQVEPSEVYNLAGQSSVGKSFEFPLETTNSIAASTVNQLEVIRTTDSSIKFFNAGSGECFGSTSSAPANEGSVFNPQSPYAAAKAAAAWQVRIYRRSYNLFACTGILFNHESPLRAKHFVTKKIVSAAKKIALGSQEKLYLGNTSIRRDWGWAPEYVIAMWAMLNQTDPEDYVIATGELQSLQEFLEVVFAEANLDWRDHVVIDPSLLRPSDPAVSYGDPAKIRRNLNWQPLIKGAEVAREMYRGER